jgi:anti-sigma regulatory factor (Ser/Thr protein kinase)
VSGDCVEATFPGSDQTWHRAFNYRSAEDFVSVVVPYLEAGIARGDTVLAVTSQANTALIRDNMRESDPIDFVDSAEWYTTPARTMVAYDQYVTDCLASQRGPILILGEPTWGDLPNEDQMAWHCYESLLNLTLSGRQVSLICPYDASALAQPLLDVARSTHPAVLDSGSETVNAMYCEPAQFLARGDESPLTPAPPRAVTVKFGASDLTSLRHLVAQRAADLSMTARQIADLVVAANEVATNAIQHGQGRGQLAIWRNETHLVIEISDHGSGPHDPFAGQLRPRDTGVSDSGWGLWVARQLCDRFELRSAPGWVVRLHARLDR